MAMPLAVLPANLSKYATRVQMGVTRLVRVAASTAGAHATEGTPVDTGESRSNWMAVLNGGGRIPNNVRPPYLPYPKYSQANGAGRGETANLMAALNQQRMVVMQYDAGRHNDITIYNNGPDSSNPGESKIGNLNRGVWPSSQAAPGFVQRAVQAARRAVRLTRLL